VVSTTQDAVNETKEQTKSDIEEIKETSFSDYFTEAKNEEKYQDSKVQDSINKTTIPPVQKVIPPTAVELHQQITGDQSNQNMNYQTTQGASNYTNGNGNGNGYEHKLQDNSYYIWYKDSEPNVNDTQTMSYEYELLYQATKEAEYKSKLRIYVTTFILFFSIVLLLLILSPVIYKVFFNPNESQQTEEPTDGTSSNGIEPTQPSSDNQASVNSLDDIKSGNNTGQNNTGQNNTTTPPSTTSLGSNDLMAQEQPKQEQPKQEQPKQEQPKQQTKQETSPSNLSGVTKNSVGWMDEKNRVIYVQLENGKFTIQESAWDSDAKANKRLSTVGGIIPGLKGTVVKADLGAKGTWYRTRFGEFTTLEEAKSKAEELRNKERMKLHAMLLSFLLYA
jgi:hypothetical protein